MNSQGWGQIALSAATDGTSNTIFVSETIQGLRSESGGLDYRGGLMRAESSLFTTYFEPNSKQPDRMFSGCVNRDGQPCMTQPAAGTVNADGVATFGIRHSARSHHMGGASASFADGSVRFASDTVDRNVWRILGAAASGQSASL